MTAAEFYLNVMPEIFSVEHKYTKIVPADALEAAEKWAMDVVDACKELEQDPRADDVYSAYVAGIKYSGVPFDNKLYDEAFKECHQGIIIQDVIPVIISTFCEGYLSGVKRQTDSYII